MTNNKIGVFVDLSNLYYCVKTKFNGRIDYSKYLVRATKDGVLYRAYAYGAQINDQASTFMERLKEYGYIPKYKETKRYANHDLVDFSIFDQLMLGHEQRTAINKLKVIANTKTETRKADWDVGIAIDIVRLLDRVDTIVLGTGDGDYAPVVGYIKERGAHCIIFGCNISAELKKLADETIEIDESVLQ